MKATENQLDIPLDGGGCAAKIDSESLRQLLSFFPKADDPRVLTRIEDLDDGAVYRLDDETVLVFNVDFISPVVSDAKTFGEIAVANALSDIYAKGVRPRLAMNILGFPANLDQQTAASILKGGLEKAQESATLILGGHSLSSRAVFYGLACIGWGPDTDILFNRRAKPGDHLILTKPLGSGVVTTGIAEAAIGAQPPGNELLQQATVMMTRTNAVASQAMVASKASAATDISGFGLIGHLCEVLDASGVTAQLWLDQIPVLDGVIEYVASGYPFCSIQKNLTRFEKRARLSHPTETLAYRLLFDAQTSGGLLIAIPESRSQNLLKNLHDLGVEQAAIIGQVSSAHTAEDTPEILVRPSR